MLESVTILGTANTRVIERRRQSCARSGLRQGSDGIEDPSGIDHRRPGRGIGEGQIIGRIAKSCRRKAHVEYAAIIRRFGKLDPASRINIAVKTERRSDTAAKDSLKKVIRPRGSWSVGHLAGVVFELALEWDCRVGIIDPDCAGDAQINRLRAYGARCRDACTHHGGGKHPKSHF
jgi:hypothetical protein